MNNIDIASTPIGNQPVCIVCGPASKVALRFVKTGYNIYHCSLCGLMFVHPQPSNLDLMQIYDENYFKRGNKYIEGEELKTSSSNIDNDIKKIQIVKKYKKSGKLLDVGCAMGGFLDLARYERFDVMGVEISRYSADYARKKLGIDVYNGDLISAQLPSNEFDVITMWDVIEHLPNPVGNFLESYRILKPGGMLFFTTGDSSSRCARLMGRLWHLMTPPQHLFFFTKRSLMKLLDHCGFVAEGVSYPGKHVYLDFILFKAQETFGPIIYPFRFIATALNCAKFRIYINFYDIMTCVAQKKID